MKDWWTDTEGLRFQAFLEAKFAGRPKRTTNVGHMNQILWVYRYIRLRDAGVSPDAAIATINEEINFRAQMQGWPEGWTPQEMARIRLGELA